MKQLIPKKFSDTYATTLATEIIEATGEIETAVKGDAKAIYHSGQTANTIADQIKGQETEIGKAVQQLAAKIQKAVTGDEAKKEDEELSQYKDRIETALSVGAGTQVGEIAVARIDKADQVKEKAHKLAHAIAAIEQVKKTINQMCKVKDSLPGETITGAIGSQALAVQKAIEQYASDKQANTIIANADKIAKDIVGITEIKLAAPGSGIPFFILRHVIAWVLREKASDIAGVIESDSGDGTTTAGIINPVLNEIKDNKLVVAAFVKNVIAGIILSGAGGITKGGVLERR